MLIIASAGIHTSQERNNTKMILAGADVMRVNFSRHKVEENIELIYLIKKIINDLHANTRILIDMPMFKPRLGEFEIKMFAVQEGEEFTCKSAPFSSDCNEFIPVHIPKLGEHVRLNQTVTIGDGEVALQIIEIIDVDTIKIRVLNDGVLRYSKTFNVAHQTDEAVIMRKYEQLLNQISVLEPDYLGIPYIHQAVNEKIKNMQILQTDPFHSTKLIIRLETPRAVRDAPIIFQDPAYQMAVLDRGEMAVNAPFEQMGILQQQIISMSKKLGKPLVVSTQILESTINNHIPSRAEISDLTTLTYSGIHGIMFCLETGYGSRPAYTISVAKKIINEVEENKNTFDISYIKV